MNTMPSGGRENVVLFGRPKTFLELGIATFVCEIGQVEVHLNLNLAHVPLPDQLNY